MSRKVLLTTKACLCPYMEKKDERRYECLQCKACYHNLNLLLKEQKPQFILFGGDGTQFCVKKTSRDCKNEKPSRFLKKTSANHNQVQRNLSQMKSKIILIVE